MLTVATTEENSPMTIADLIVNQAQDRTGNELTRKVGLANTSFDTNEILIRTSRIDQPQQMMVPPSQQARVLYLAHDALLTGHPGGTRMYEIMSRKYY